MCIKFYHKPEMTEKKLPLQRIREDPYKSPKKWGRASESSFLSPRPERGWMSSAAGHKMASGSKSPAMEATAPESFGLEANLQW
jgi:hypothetical protein